MLAFANAIFQCFESIALPGCGILSAVFSELIVDISARGVRRIFSPDILPEIPDEGKNPYQKSEDGTDDAAGHAGNRHSVKIAEVATGDDSEDDGENPEGKTDEPSAAADERQNPEHQRRD